MRGEWPARIRPAEREAAVAALARTGAERLAMQSVTSLSGGEWQRVHLARCLARGSKLLLLDEPASGLDVAGQGAFFHLLEDFREETGATILMVTHDWEGVRAHADEVLLVQGGTVQHADPADLADEHALLELFGHVGHIRETHGNGGDA
jgi:zinc transport system ATP-binding protein